jgi:hypothetical protein
MKKILISLLAGAPLLLLLNGCASHQGAYAPVGADQGNLENIAKFVLLDPGAQRSVTCTGLQEGKTADGRLQVKANVLNRENRRIEVQMNCVFKDEQGFTLEETSFESLILTENETRGAEFTAMSDKAKSYTIRIRQAR